MTKPDPKQRGVTLSGLGHGDVEVEGKDVAYEGMNSMHLYALRHKQFSGTWTPVIKREAVHSPDAAILLPYDPVRDEVVLLEQFRVGPFDRGDPAWTLECVAGGIDPGETPENTAVREALEEAGCVVETLEKIAELYPSPGVLSKKYFLYCGKTDTSKIGGLHGLDEHNEDIRAFAAPFEEAMAATADGRINVISCVLALQWLSLNRDRLRKAWS